MMNIYRIDPTALKTSGRPLSASWNLSPEFLAHCPSLPDFAAAARRLQESAGALLEFSAMDIAEFFDVSARRAVETIRPGEAVPPGIAYLVPFLSKENLARLLRVSLYGCPESLDRFILMESLGKRLRAAPRGILSHWVAANVPALGMISLVQGVLTKNANVVKLPRRNGRILPEFFSRLTEFDIRAESGRMIPGKSIAESVLFVYAEADDAEALNLLSLASDVKLVWGGQNAVDSILKLPKKPGGTDVVFGPRTSLAVIGREASAGAGIDKIAEKLAFDASLFDQHGCSSPQTAFVERGSSITPLEFARSLAKAMEKILKRIPKEPASADDAYAVASVRNEYALAGDVFASEGTEWTVVYSEEKGLARPIGSRVVFVRPVDDVRDVLDWIGPEIQTLGLALDEPRRTEFAQAAAQRGISRIAPLGSMNSFDYPWDGVFPMERFVRWISLE